MRTSILLFVGMVVCASHASAGRIVVNHDEWTTTNAGFTNAGAANVTTYLQNVAEFLQDSPGPGNFLVYSTNMGFAQSNFATALTSAGHTLTVNTAITFDLATLMAFDGVFIALPPAANTTVLTDYVNAGGGVYLQAGTAVGVDATGEANTWNPFLNNFGLGLQGGAYNLVIGNLPVTGTHEIFSGVSNLYHNNGSTVVLFGANPYAQIVEQTGGGIGLIGVYDDLSHAPEPTTWLFLLTGLALTGIMKRRRSS